MNVKPSSSNQTIAFTLPISCQICLGKVKQPVLCPNNHVFCGPCLEVWLERNQQCPACRVDISDTNPCKQIIGGLNPDTQVVETFSRDLRRARMELIYKDYENEIDRLEAELEATRQDNRDLRHRLQKHSHHGNPVSPPNTVTTEADRTTISLLNKNIKDASTLYERVKEELSELKKENDVLREKNSSLSREVKTLRLDLVSRSPRRYGRYTVATLESKVETSDRQIKQLQKALEKSDSYIEELQKELALHRKEPRTDNDPELSVISRLDSQEDDNDLPSKLESFESHLNDSAIFRENRREKSSSFDLEMPSMEDSALTMKSGDGQFSDLNGGGDDSFQLPKPQDEPTLDSCKKKLRFCAEDKPTKSSSQVRFSLFKDDQPSTSRQRASKPDELNVSMTPDLEDCMRIMDEAKRKLDERHTPAANVVNQGFNALDTVARPHDGGLTDHRSHPLASSMPHTTTFASSQPLAVPALYPTMESLSQSLGRSHAQNTERASQQSSQPSSYAGSSMSGQSRPSNLQPNSQSGPPPLPADFGHPGKNFGISQSLAAALTSSSQSLNTNHSQSSGSVHFASGSLSQRSNSSFVPGVEGLSQPMFPANGSRSASQGSYVSKFAQSQ